MALFTLRDKRQKIRLLKNIKACLNRHENPLNILFFLVIFGFMKTYGDTHAATDINRDEVLAQLTAQEGGSAGSGARHRSVRAGVRMADAA